MAQPAAGARSATSPGPAGPGCGSRSSPRASAATASPEVRELTLKTAALLESLGHQVEEIDNPVPDTFVDDFLLFWSMLAMVIVRSAASKDFGATWDPTKLDNLTLGLAKHAAPQPPQAALLDRRAAGLADALAARHRASYDVTLTPTLATETPRVGHLRPDQDYDEIMGRLMDWVAFTPLQNATGEPAISLPLATTADRAAAGHDAGRRSGPRGPPPGAGLRARGGRRLAPDPGGWSSTGLRGADFSSRAERVYRSPSLPL